jgi:hypothetical protein
VNVFVLGRSKSGPLDDGTAKAALADLADRLPYLAEAEVRLWHSADGSAMAAHLAHGPDRLGGVRYAAFEPDRMALFAGRPLQWVAEDSCHGRDPLDPRHFLRPPEQWVEGLDGRCAIARWDPVDEALEVYTDPQGCYPVFWAAIGDAWWLSNSPRVLARMKPAGELRRSALAALIGCDHSLDGESWWQGVERIPRGAVWRLRSGGRRETAERLPVSEMASLFGAGFEADLATRLITTAVAACADWPGRRNVLPLTAGRDSRTVLAAALRAGVELSTMTVALPWSPGWPETEDVRRGRELSYRAGLSHELAAIGPRASVFEDPAASARTLAVVAPLPVSQYDLMTLPPTLPSGPLDVVHMGLGGEFARARFGTGTGLDANGLAEHLTNIVMPEPPQPIVSPEGREVIARTVRAEVDEYLGQGVAPADVPDVFYLNNHMAPWGGGVQGAHEYVQDSVSAMWSWRLLAQEWGLPAEIRRRNIFQLHVLQRLSADLMRVPFQGDPWPRSARPRRERYGHIAGVLLDELRLRAPSRRPEWDGRSPIDLFASYLAHVREHVAAHPRHQVWDVLDRRRVERLLRRPAGLWDRRSRSYAWRLGTVFMSDIQAP